MTRTPRIALIVTSTRDSRWAEKPAQWMLKQAQARTERGRVFLGDAIGEDNLCGDAVTRQHLQALAVIPGAGQFPLDRRPPGVIDLLDQEL